MYRIKSKSRLVGMTMALWAGAMMAGTAEARSLRAGDRMPNFTLRDINGKTVSLSKLRNKAVWITFFGST